VDASAGLFLWRVSMKTKNDNHLSYREIAFILGISHGTVINIERRALKKMLKEANPEFRQLLGEIAK
jgi:transposase